MVKVDNQKIRLKDFNRGRYRVDWYRTDNGQIHSSQYENSFFDAGVGSLDINIPFPSTISSWQDFAFKVEYDPLIPIVNQNNESGQRSLMLYDTLNTAFLDETGFAVYYNDTTNKTITRLKPKRTEAITDDVLIYPNPANNFINISSNIEIVRVEIINSLNQIIQKGSYSSRDLKINTSFLSPSSYTLRVLFSNSSSSFYRFIKL